MKVPAIISFLVLLCTTAVLANTRELPEFWYDLIVAERLAKMVDENCSTIKADSLVAYRLRNVTVGRLAEEGIHMRTPREAMTEQGMHQSLERLGWNASIDVCDFATSEVQSGTEFGMRLRVVAK